MASLLDLAEGKRPSRAQGLYGWSPNDLPELIGPSMDATAGGPAELGPRP